MVIRELWLGILINTFLLFFTHFSSHLSPFVFGSSNLWLHTLFMGFEWTSSPCLCNSFLFPLGSRILKCSLFVCFYFRFTVVMFVFLAFHSVCRMVLQVLININSLQASGCTDSFLELLLHVIFTFLSIWKMVQIRETVNGPLIVP